MGSPVELLSLRIIWDRNVIPLRHNDLGFHQLHISPEPGHPFGRKGLAIATAWQQISTRTAGGLLLLDGDVVIDPADLAAMHAALSSDPESVWTAPTRLWPISTKRATWVWGHKTGMPEGEQQGDPGDTDPRFRFSFCFTYLPRRLVDHCIKQGMRTWAYPHCDMRTHQHAARQGFKVRIVPDCWPTHLNY